jgi:hypothetical protein
MLLTTTHILGFYVVVIGTWRLANATAPAPMGSQLHEYARKMKTYNPVWDLLSPHLVACWMVRTVLKLKQPGKFTDSVILHKQFNWGLMWLLLGLSIQFVCALVK